MAARKKKSPAKPEKRRVYPGGADLKKFNTAIELITPLAQFYDPVILRNRKLVVDGTKGFNMIYNYYKNEVAREHPGIEPLSKHNFLFHLSDRMLNEGSVTIERLGDGEAHRIRSAYYDVSGVFRAARDIALEIGLALIDPCDPDAIDAILQVWGTLIYVRAVAGEMSECAFGDRDGYYNYLAKRADDLATSYRKKNREKYDAALATMSELYDIYRDRKYALKTVEKEESKVLAQEPFYVIFAFQSYLTRLTNGAALDATFTVLTNTAPLTPKTLEKQFGTDQIRDILTIVYGFDLASEKELLGKYAVPRKGKQ